MLSAKLYKSLLWLAFGVRTLNAFAPQALLHYGRPLTVAFAQHDDETSHWLQEFTTNTGEVVNPYQVLRLKRTCTTSEVKFAYRALSRKYHPDGNIHRPTILPGSCNNWGDVRDEWERISLSYSILKDSKLRKKYDRNEFLADPSEGMKRAAIDAAFSGLTGMGKGFADGIFGLGKATISHIGKSVHERSEREMKRKVSNEADVSNVVVVNAATIETTKPADNNPQQSSSLNETEIKLITTNEVPDTNDANTRKRPHNMHKLGFGKTT
jgi:DnaJ-class molecular chaperone